MPDDNVNLLAAATTPQTDTPAIGQVPEMKYDAAKYTDPFSKEMETLETFAADQPAYKASQKRLAGQEAEFQTAGKRLQGLYDKPPETPDYDKFQKNHYIPELKNETEYAKSSTSTYCLMALFGGILGKSNARVALNAQASCLEALNEGNHGRYLLAKQAHDDAISNMDREWKNYMEAYKVGEKIYEGQINSAQLSMDMANRAIGVEEKTQQGIVGNISKAYGQFNAIRQKKLYNDATLDLRKEALQVSRFRAGTTAAKYWSDKTMKLDAADQQISILESSLQEASDLWDTIKSSKELQSMKFAPIAAETIDTINKVNSKEYAKLSQMFSSASEQALAFQSTGLSTGAQRIKAVEVNAIKGLPNLTGKTQEQVSESIRALLQKAKEQKQFLEAQRKFVEEQENKVAESAGMTPPNATDPTSPPPAAAPKVIKSADVTKYYNDHKASFPQGEASAKAYLEQNGYKVQ